MYKIKVGSIADLQKQKKVVIDTVKGKIVVFSVDDKFYAIDDICTHSKASLSEGILEENVIECPLHGAKFNVQTGEALSLPAVKPVNVYKIKVEDSLVYLEL